MNYLKIEQKSPEWWQYKVAKVSGTRFGQLISTRENSLIDEMANELLDGFILPDEYINDDMLFGIENEPVALDLAESMFGVEFERGGVIASDFAPDVHMASPDGVNENQGIVAEVKCTENGRIHLARFRKGIESAYKPQVVNYFAASDDVKEVWWMSFCPYRPERELIRIVVTRDTIYDAKKKLTYGDVAESGRNGLLLLQDEVKELANKFKDTF